MKRIKSLVIVFLSIVGIAISSCDERYIDPIKRTEGENQPIIIDDDDEATDTSIEKRRP